MEDNKAKAYCIHKDECFPQEVGCIVDGYDPPSDCPNYRVEGQTIEHSESTTNQTSETGAIQDDDQPVEKSNNINQGENQQEVSSKTHVDRSTKFPWTANTLGLKNLSLITRNSSPITIGVVGMPGSGKTTFLATLYCLLSSTLALCSIC